jgi:hypothetical protein
MRLFFDYPLTTGDQHLSMSAMGNCANPQLSFRIVASDGHEETAKTLASGNTGYVSQVFNIPADAGKHQFLELDVSTAPASLCRFDLRDLTVTAQPQIP